MNTAAQLSAAFSTPDAPRSWCSWRHRILWGAGNNYSFGSSLGAQASCLLVFTTGPLPEDRQAGCLRSQGGTTIVVFLITNSTQNPVWSACSGLVLLTDVEFQLPPLPAVARDAPQFERADFGDAA